MRFIEAEAEYMETLENIKKAKEFPPPIIINYNGKDRLISGNRRAIALHLSAIKNKEQLIPVKLIVLES